MLSFKNSLTVYGVSEFLLAFGLAPIAVTPAHATHGDAATVDSIDGNGTGIFAGTLTNTSDTVDWYEFFGDAGDAVTIDMVSLAFDTCLQLYLAPSNPTAGDSRASYTLVDFDDDGGTGTNSLISIGSLAATGFYVVAAESFSGTNDTLGDYLLGIGGDVRPIPEPAAIAIFGLGLAGLGFARRRKAA